MNKKITFPELIETVATATETSKRTSEVFLKELFAVISNSLVNGENVRIKNFGQFKLTEVGERKSVNVNTGEEMQIPSHTKVTFTPDKSLADAINMPFASFETVEISGNATEEELKMMSSADQLPEKATESLPQEEDVAVAGDDVKEVEQESADDVVVAGGDDDVATLDEQPEVENSSMKEQPAVIIEETGDTKVEADDAEKQEDEEDAVTVSDEAESGDAEGEESGGDTEEADSDMSEQVGGEEKTGRLDDLRRRLEERYAVPYKSTLFFRGFFWGVVTMLAVAAVAFYSYYLYNEENKAYDQAMAFANAQHEKVGDESAVRDTVASSVPFVPDDAAGVAGKPVVADTVAVPQHEEEPVADAPRTASGGDEEAVRYDTVTRSRYLTTMSREYYGDFRFWVYIYEENKSKIKDPNAIAPGTAVVIPPAEKYGIDKDSKESIDRARAKAVAILGASGN